MTQMKKGQNLVDPLMHQCQEIGAYFDTLRKEHQSTRERHQDTRFANASGPFFAGGTLFP